MLSLVVIAAVLQSTATPYAGVVYEVHVEDSIPARLHVVEVDLSSQEIHLVATEASDRGTTVAEFAAPDGAAAALRAHIAINGDYFSAVGFSPAGLAMGGGIAWADSADDELAGFFRFDRNADVNRASLSPPEAIVAPDDLPAGTLGVVGGRPLLVQDGAALSAFDCDDTIAMPCERAPRSAVALSADARTMWLVVVDGWQPASSGMTAAELATFLRERGAANALLLDGGSSSSLYIHAEDGIVNTPSDGVPRRVANHLGVYFGTLPPGEMLGIVRECSVDNEGAELADVDVELDDGQVRTTGADGRYDFANLTPRWACVTATKAGYAPKTQCRQVVPEVITFNSIGLAPLSGCPTLDAGPRPDGGTRADAAPVGTADGSAQTGPDAGRDGDDPSTCGCRLSRNAGFGSLWPLWGYAVALILVRSKRSRS